MRRFSLDSLVYTLLLVSSCAETSTKWNDLLTDKAPGSLVVYDLRYVYEGMSAADGYEETQLVSALAGLVNRNDPNLYLILESIDSIWLSYFTSSGKWLANTQLINITSGSVEDLLAYFDISSSFYLGAVVYDPNTWCSSAVALTSAGAEDLLPIAYRPNDADSLYSKLIDNGPMFSVERNLVGLFTGNVSGSVKEDCYVWATDNFIKTNKSDATHLNYYVDYYWASNDANAGNDGWEKAEIPNLDFGVSKRGFFFDLSVWADEAPVDEPSQPLGSDLYAFKYMLSAAYNTTRISSSTTAYDQSDFDGQLQSSMIVLHGFTPWAYKYVSPNGNHEGVETEWATVLITSAYNVIVDADACCIGNMANAALWQYYPLKDRYVQPTLPPSKQQLIDKGLLTSDGSQVVTGKLYYMFYAGDYDSAAWLYSQLLSRWNDPQRGSVPIGWGIDPMLSERFPPIFPLIIESMSNNDTIISGDSGAGYLNPTMLYGDQRMAQSGVSDSGVETWVALNKALNNQFDISFTGFSISGDAPQPTSFDEAIYFNFSSNGLVDQGWPNMVAHLTSPKLPVITQWDISTDVDEATETILSYLPNDSSISSGEDSISWMMFRSVLTSPTYLNSVALNAQSESGGKAVPVTPLELAYMFRIAYESDNNDRVTYLNDTLPPSIISSDPSNSQLVNISFDVLVRNDGWNTLSASNVGVLVNTVATQSITQTTFSSRKTASSAPTHISEKLSRNFTVPIISSRRDKWIHEGFIPLNQGHHMTNSLRKKLSMRGYVGHASRELSQEERQSSSQVFMLSEDIDFLENTSVPIEYSLNVYHSETVSLLQRNKRSSLQEEGGGGEEEGGEEEEEDYLLTLEYQLVKVNPDTGDVLASFDQFGNIPWRAEVLVVVSSPSSSLRNRQPNIIKR